jgi:hypothetical protein
MHKNMAASGGYFAGGHLGAQMAHSLRLMVRGNEKKLSQNSNLKMVTEERPISGTW